MSRGRVPDSSLARLLTVSRSPAGCEVVMVRFFFDSRIAQDRYRLGPELSLRYGLPTVQREAKGQRLGSLHPRLGQRVQCLIPPQIVVIPHRCLLRAILIYIVRSCTGNASRITKVIDSLDWPRWYNHINGHVCSSVVRNHHAV